MHCGCCMHLADVCTAFMTRKDGFHILWHTHAGCKNREEHYPVWCCILEALLSWSLFPWFWSETPSAGFPLHICMLCISLGLPREIKDDCSCYDLSALHAAQRFLPYLTYTWQHSWKATRWSRVLYWQYAGSSFPSSIPNRAQFVLLTATCSCVLLLDQSLINFSLEFLQQKIEWIQQRNFWQLFPGSCFTGLANSS